MSPKPARESPPVLTFIDHLLEHTKEYESPTSFWRWSAFAAIAAVIRDNCYRRRGDSYLFPNIYVLLSADSGQRKDAPVKLCEALVSRVNNTKVISGRTSIQAILDALAHTETNAKTGKVDVKGSSGIFIAPELAAGLVADEQAVAILTDLYDFKQSYTETLRGRPGKMQLERVVFSFMAASNSAMLANSVFNTFAVEGGLLGRTFLVTASEFRPSNALLRNGDKSDSYLQMFDLLTGVSQLKGEFILTEEAITAYENWYVPFRDSYKNRTDKSGVISRIHTGVLKLAMILAANELTLTIDKKHIESSIDNCAALIPNYNQFLMLNGRSNISEAGALILESLAKAKDGVQSRKTLVRENLFRFDLETLDKVVTSMETAGILQTMMEGSEINYKLTEKWLEKMRGGVGE